MDTHVLLTKLVILCAGYSAQDIAQFGNPFVFLPFNSVPQWDIGDHQEQSVPGGQAAG